MASMIARNLIKNFKNNNNVKNILQRGLATKIDGNAVASEIRAEIAAATAELCSKYGKQPGLAVGLVGDRPDSAKYVSMKKKAANKLRNLGVDREVMTLVKQVIADKMIKA